MMAMNDEIKMIGNRDGLTFSERTLLEEKVLPTARKWVVTYHPSSFLHQSAKQTLAYWGER
jgi:hypothetical protein